ARRAVPSNQYPSWPLLRLPSQVTATGGFIGFVARRSADQCRPAMAAAWIITSNKKEPQG
ncbi:MAG: hypothetical protein WBL81_22055, partial [Pseudolabrys sp.]